MAADDKSMTLKCECKSWVLLHPNDFLEGVYYKDENENEDENIN